MSGTGIHVEVIVNCVCSARICLAEASSIVDVVRRFVERRYFRSELSYSASVRVELLCCSLVGDQWSDDSSKEEDQSDPEEEAGESVLAQQRQRTDRHCEQGWHRPKQSS